MLNTWTQRWNIPPQAIAELMAIMGAVDVPVPTVCDGKSETAAQQNVRAEAPRHGIRLWRNNNGATYDENGRMIRYGLANESASLSKKLKSSDLIGITPYVVKPVDVGQILGVFTSIEMKKPGWKYTGTDREQAQLAWIQLIISLGGKAQFATGPDNVNW